MLAELAAANAAFSVIKQVVQNGSDIVKAGAAIAKFVGAKEDLQRKTSGKKKGAATGETLQAFLALEQIRVQEKELKEFMIYCGRPGLWTDWVRYQANARKERREAEAAAKKRKKKILYNMMLGSLAMVFIGIAGLIIFIVYMAAQSR